MPLTLEQAQTLKQKLLDFTFDAEGAIAVALEEYSAEQLSQLAESPYQGNRKTELVIDSFATDGIVDSQSVLEHFLADQSDLSPEEQALVASWAQGFIGLFAVTERSSDRMVIMNWLTEKTYTVVLPETQQDRNIARLKPEDILLTRILPLHREWMLSGPAVFLGKLGKPKLAVAIGNFKKYHPDYLYGDAPELLEEAWQSVERYHQSFVDYFGSHEITLPGHQLEKKLADFQAQMSQKQLIAAGLDGEKSLAELAEESGISPEEMTETAAAMGVDEKITSDLLKSQKVSKMMMPTIELPKHLRSSEQVTILTHPRWGQVMVATYQPLIAILKDFDQNPSSEREPLLLQCLKNLEIKPFVWYELAQQYPQQLELALQNVLDRPQLHLDIDLDSVLTEFGHPTQPKLPETASAPIHLHNLFQAALLEVSRPQTSKSKDRDKPPKKSGFG